MPPRGLSPSGLVLADKPPGPSSFAIVRRLRNATGARAGHAGTLDPFASGLLLVLLGTATRLARYLVGLDKRYVTTIDLSATTTTGDPEGDLVEEHPPPSEGELAERIASLRGDVELPVPAASAVKIGGERAYRLARRGAVVEMPIRRSHVHEMRLLAYESGLAELDLRVSSGTYVRSLAEALGGHCRTLRRLDVGPFSADDVDEEKILPPLAAVPFLPVRTLSSDEAARVQHGRALHGEEAGTVALVHDGELIAVGRGDGTEIRPETVLSTTAS